MNFETLGKIISQHNLWWKTLAELTPEDVLILANAFAIANIESVKTCGSCHYYGWRGLDSWCLHIEHPARIFSCRWSLACPDYSNEFDKELGPHKLNRKERLSD